MTSARTVSSTPSVIATQREARVVRKRALDVEGVEALDGDDCADLSFHGGYRFVWELISFWSSSVVIDFAGGSLASPAGRKRNHMTPVSDARASVEPAPR